MSVVSEPRLGGVGGDVLEPSAPAANPRRTAFPLKIVLLDIAERTFLITLFALCASRMLSSFAETLNVVTLLIVISEVLPIYLILNRRWTNQVSQKPLDWFLGLSGASIGLLVMPSDEPSLMAPEICSLIFVLGMIIQISAKIALGRSFGVIAASRGVKVSGPYRFVRHPMYMGYFVCHIGVLSTFPSRYNLILYATAFCVQIVRLLREEHLLNNDAKYRAFAAQVRYRILPGVF